MPLVVVVVVVVVVVMAIVVLVVTIRVGRAVGFCPWLQVEEVRLTWCYSALPTLLVCSISRIFTSRYKSRRASSRAML